MEMARAEMDILFSAMEDSMSCAGTRAPTEWTLPLPRTLWETMHVLLPSVVRRRPHSIMYLTARAGILILSAIMASNVTINLNTGLMNAVWEALRNTLPGWTKTRLIGRTLLEKTAVITWTGPRLRQLTWLDSKVKFKRNKLTDSHPQEWVLGEAVPALLEFTASTCTKPFINPWPRVVSKRDYKLRTLALLSRVAP